MSKNRKNLIQRVAMTLLALVLTSASAWAAVPSYTVTIGSMPDGVTATASSVSQCPMAMLLSTAVHL